MGRGVAEERLPGGKAEVTALDGENLGGGEGRGVREGGVGLVSWGWWGVDFSGAGGGAVSWLGV